MKISIFGLGYVGCVTSACLARDGHEVIGIDVNPQKVAQINSGRPTVIEPNLDEFVAEAVRLGKLRATGDSLAAVQDTDLSLICVGTPSNGNGSLDRKYLKHVCAEIGSALAAKASYHLVVVRSTVLPNTVRNEVIPLIEEQSGKQVGRDFGVCMNPEFLREGSAIKDYYRPSYILIGEGDKRSGDLVEAMYAAVDAPAIRTSLETAEMSKYVCNAFHALKVAFANEIGNLCKTHGVDGQEVMAIFAQDDYLNISPAYLKPGFAFGGSCLPKDVRALVYTAKQQDLEIPLLNAILPSNQRQIERAIAMVEQTGCKKIGILGLSFKAATDDVRESPTIPLVETLVGRGYQLSVFDDQVKLAQLVGTNKSFLEKEIPHIASLMYSSIEAVVERSEVIVITNNNSAFSSVLELMNKDQILIDLVGSAKHRNGFGGHYDGICW